jgi:diguanylate cyclase (GGDEF)-like protein
MSSGAGGRGGQLSGLWTGGPLARIAALSIAAAALVLLAGRADGPWLCVPLALAACAGTPSARGALGAAAAVLAAVLIASLAGAGTGAGVGSHPPPALLTLVVMASAGVLTVVRERLARERDALRGYALTDPLTQIANRRSLLVRADYEIERHRRARRSFALVMLDLDGFKRLNDRFGHPAGDSLLRDVAGALQRAMRAQDTVARFGGDEFCVLAPETDAAGVERLTDRIAQAVDGVTVGLEAVHASLGVALFPFDGSGAPDLLDAADQQLLEAKRRRGPGRPAPRRAAA